MTQHTPGPYQVSNNPNCKANARLIAAAPVTLSALETLTRAINVPEPDPILVFAAIEKARAAIAKATGE